MKYILGAGLLFTGVMAWRISERLSADTIGMALGVLFGVLAGLPVALLVLAAQRRPSGEERPPASPQRAEPRLSAPPIIVLTGANYAGTLPHQTRPNAQHETLLSRNGASDASWRLLPGADDGEDWT